MTKLNFKCSECGGDTLELVITDCIVQTPFELFNEEPYVIYGENEVLDGDFDIIQCGNCGYIIQDNDGNNMDEDEIHDWVENQIKKRGEK